MLFGERSNGLAVAKNKVVVHFVFQKTLFLCRGVVTAYYTYFSLCQHGKNGCSGCSRLVL